jgi:uncharacterized protein (TIGR03086 family)
MTPFPDLAPGADRVAALLPAVTDDMLDAPTPCADTSVGQLLSHLHGLALAFRLGAEKAPDPGPPPATPPALTPHWRTELPERLDALVAAWRVPESREGTTSVGGVEMPAASLAVVALDELVLHGWDLARAVGQRYQPDPASVEACLGFVSAVARPEGVPGLFGPSVPVADDAPALDRLLGLAGRDPSWTPPA